MDQSFDLGNPWFSKVEVVVNDESNVKLGGSYSIVVAASQLNCSSL